MQGTLGIRSFFRPASKGGKQGPRRQPSPAADGAAVAATAGAVVAEMASVDRATLAPPAAVQQQFARKRKRPSGGMEVATTPAGSTGSPPAPPALLYGSVPDAVPAVVPAPAGAARAKAGPRPLTQLYLDVGQRDFHSYRCLTCGMLYARGTEADERLHAMFHASAAQGPRYQGWQGERVAAVDGSRGRVLLFHSADQERGRKPLQELCRFLEEQMGLPGGWLLRVPLKLLLYVSATRRIQACVAAEAIKDAFHVQPSLAPSMQQGMHSCSSAVAASSSGVLDTAGSEVPGQHAATSQTAVAAAATAVQVATSDRSLLLVTLSSGSAAAATAECSGGRGSAVALADRAEAGQQQEATGCLRSPQQQQPAGSTAGHGNTSGGAAASVTGPLLLDRRQRVRALCGVRLMWVPLDARRQGLATRLLDCCRCQFMPGYVLPRHELAFSAPTDAGRAFIEAYSGTRRFLVYE